jgi:hypothetical protein
MANAKLLIGWGLCLAGAGLLAVSVLRGTTFLVKGAAVPWSVVLLNLIVAAVLIIGGTYVHRGLALGRRVALVKSWLIVAVFILGMCVVTRFLMVLFDFVSAGETPHWVGEIAYGIMGLASLIIGLRGLKSSEFSLPS